MLPYKACQVGDPVANIETPALVLDLDAFERNLDLLMRQAGQMRVRPHAKSHKCPAIAHRQMAKGAVGICCQKLSEAVVFAQAGLTDILITNQVVGASKLARLADLSQQCQLGVLVDDLAQVRALGSAMAGLAKQLDVYVEVEVGGQRCGAVAELVPELVDAILANSGLRFAGLHCYHGAAQHYREVGAREQAINKTVQTVERVVATLKTRGIDVPCVTGAGTGTFWWERDSGCFTEIQPGSYALMDRDYADNAVGPSDVRFEHALFIKSSVTSVSHANFAVVDAGLKALSVDSGMPGIYQGQGLSYQKASDEHGVVTLGTGRSLVLGQTVWLIPGHCDPTVNLYDDLIVVSNGQVVDIWPIAARGASL